MCARKRDVPIDDLVIGQRYRVRYFYADRPDQLIGFYRGLVCDRRGSWRWSIEIESAMEITHQIETASITHIDVYEE